MTVFLEKLRKICTSCPDEVGGWTPDGTSFEVRNANFELLLKNYFKGSVKTKSEAVNGRWTFSHPKLSRDNPDAVLEITRKTRMSSVSYTPRDEFEKLKNEVSELKLFIATEVKQMKDQVGELWKVVSAFRSAKESGSNLAFNDNEDFTHFPGLNLGTRPENQFPYGQNTFNDTELMQSMPKRKKIKIAPSVCSGGTNASSDNVSDMNILFDGFPLPICDYEENFTDSTSQPFAK